MTENGGRPSTEEFFRLVEEALADRDFASLDEAQRAVDAVSDRYNRTPQAELCGLSPLQVQRLLSADWRSPGSALLLDESLALEALHDARTLHNARRFLRTLREAGGTRATKAGNLNRAFVGAMVEGLNWRPGFREELYRFNRVVNERDAFPLHVLRVLLQEAGLIARLKGAFHATRKAEDLLSGARAGELLALLFRTHFRRLNLAYLDGAAEAPEFQDTVGFTLHRLGALPPRWRRAEEMVEDILLPSVREAIPVRGGWDPAALILRTRLLDPLEGLGLVELREEPGEHPYLPVRRYRKAPLFDRFLRFEV